MRDDVDEIPLVPLPYGEGREAQKSQSALSRPECQDYQNYTRKTHPKAIQLRKIIGGQFNLKLLESMARDIGFWTGAKCPRDWSRLEALLLCYVMNYPYLKDKWAAGAFTVQQAPPVPTSSDPETIIQVYPPAFSLLQSLSPGKPEIEGAGEVDGDARMATEDRKPILEPLTTPQLNFTLFNGFLDESELINDYATACLRSRDANGNISPCNICGGDSPEGPFSASGGFNGSKLF
jgi:hypothetical protein